jgi:Fe-S-cluster containining protein
MRDGPIRRVIKKTLAAWYLADLRRHRRRAPPLWELAGTCGGCARCCERPAISVGWLIHAPRLMLPWLWWQRVVNGFVVVERDAEARAVVFSCTHFDPVERRCDSYDSRPGMCRDYPRMLLHQPDPAFFDGCGHRARAGNADGLVAALQDAGVDGQKLVQIRRRLRVV